MQLFRKNEKAVSPVIGVMLMLVVTVILAAAVSGFSGGLVGDSSKASQLAMKADFSKSQGMTITHMGGDIINTLETNIIVSPTKDFGNYENLKWKVNTTVVMINKDGTPTKWNDPAAGSSDLARTFQPGEVAFVNAGNLVNVQPETYSTSTDMSLDAYSTRFGFLTDTAVGQRFVLSLVDSEGKTIAKTEVVIRP